MLAQVDGRIRVAIKGCLRTVDVASVILGVDIALDPGAADVGVEGNIVLNFARLNAETATDAGMGATSSTWEWC